MVRCEVVSHPSKWSFGGYNEIQSPRKKCILIAYEKLAELTGFQSYNTFRKTYKELVNKTLAKGRNVKNALWTESIAVGSKEYIGAIKKELNILTKGRKIFDSKKGNIGEQNRCFWNTNH